MIKVAATQPILKPEKRVSIVIVDIAIYAVTFPT
jgi:hypothetical protein